ncbi:MAG: hypothetical protein LBC42_02030 [Puniceicoccales bacterium]|nr:hypothetical protein [Puniceicoccales bacterium]
MNIATFPRIFAVDFEGNRREGILEFGAICLEGNELTEPIESFCRCERTHGLLLRKRKISLTHTENAPSLDTFFPLFHSMRQRGIFAAHGAAVEDFLLRRVWPSPGFVPNWPPSDEQESSWGPWLDTVALARNFMPTGTDCRLVRLMESLHLLEKWENFGQKFCAPDRRTPHCALYDAIGCALLIREWSQCNDGKVMSCITRKQLQLLLP